MHADGRRKATSIETNMWNMDAIWSEQQRLMPSMTMNTDAPSRAMITFVNDLKDQQSMDHIKHDPQAVARNIQV